MVLFSFFQLYFSFFDVFFNLFTLRLPFCVFVFFDYLSYCPLFNLPFSDFYVWDFFIRTSIFEVRARLFLLPASAAQITDSLQLLELACVVEHLPQHTTAQSAMNKAANHVRADQSATTQASSQSWREPGCRLSE